MLELGSPLEMIQLLQTPWEERFKVRKQLRRSPLDRDRGELEERFGANELVLLTLFAPTNCP